MIRAYQVYREVTPNLEIGKPQFKCYCSECGCPVYSDTLPSQRKECPHCHAEFDKDRLMTMDMWTAELNHVGYSPRECGREQ